MSKAKLYYKEILMTPMLFNLKVIVSKDYKQISEKLSSLTEFTQEEALEYIDYDECHFYKSDKTGRHLFIIIESFNICSIVHESVHATWRLCDVVGIKLTEDNHEIQAYYVEYLVKEIMAMKKDKSCLK